MSGDANSSLFGEAELQDYCYPDSNSSCVKDPIHPDHEAALYAIVMSAILVTVFGNSVVIVSIAHFKQLHTPTNILVMSLALVDLLVGIIIMPFSMVRTVDGCWYFGEDFCLMHSTLDYALTGASILHLIFIAIDRYQAVLHPLQYPSRITLPVAGIMAAVSWIAAFIYAFGFISSKAYLQGVEDYLASIDCFGNCNFVINVQTATADAVIYYLLPAGVMNVLYARIFLVSDEHVKQMVGTKQGRGVATLSQASKKMKHEKKAAKTLGLVIGVFNLCWFPYCVDTFVDPLINYSTPPALYELFNWLCYVNSSFNPIIYGLFYPWFRKTLYLMVTLKIFAADSSDIKVYAH